MTATITWTFAAAADDNYTSSFSAQYGYNDYAYNPWNHTGFSGKVYETMVYTGTYSKYSDPDYNDGDGTETLLYTLKWSSSKDTTNTFTTSTAYTPDDILITNVSYADNGKNSMQYNWVSDQSDKQIRLSDTGISDLNIIYTIQ